MARKLLIYGVRMVPAGPPRTLYKTYDDYSILVNGDSRVIGP